MSVFTDSEKFALYSINIMLETIGEQPLEDEIDLANSLEGSIASNTLEEVKKSVLSEGWDFNKDDNYSLVPNNDGFINIPLNILDINSSDDSSVIARDWRLYSKTTQDYWFEDAVSCDIIWDLEFNGLTHPIRHYITIKAARIFQARLIGEGDAFTFSMEDEQGARQAALNSDSRTKKHNWFTNNSSRAIR